MKEVDPAEFIDGDELPTLFLEQIHANRHALYRIYQKSTLHPQTTDKDQLKTGFTTFISDFCVDIRTSYGWGMYCFHCYLVTLLWNRVFYCPATDDQHIGNRANSWLPVVPVLQCLTRPFTFVDLVGAIQLGYYMIALVGYVAAPQLEEWGAVYLSNMVNGALWSAFWFASPSGGLEFDGWVLLGAGWNDGRYSWWNAAVTPCLLWILYLLCRRNAMGIYRWSHYARTAIQSQEVDLLYAQRSGVSEEKQKPTISDIEAHVFMFEQWLFIIWKYMCPIIPFLLWKAFVRVCRPDVDVTENPSWWRLALLSLSCTFSLDMWFSYLNFQYQCLLWLVPMRKGIVINNFDDMYEIGFIY